MSKWTGGELDRVRTAQTIKRDGQSERSVLELLRELKTNE